MVPVGYRLLVITAGGRMFCDIDGPYDRVLAYLHDLSDIVPKAPSTTWVVLPPREESGTNGNQES